jgi:hypothetical protein
MSLSLSPQRVELALITFGPDEKARSLSSMRTSPCSLSALYVTPPFPFLWPPNLTHDELATTLPIVHHDCAWVGQPPRLPQRIVEPELIGHDVATHGQVAPWSGPRGSKSRGAGYPRAAAQELPAGLVLKPARPEMAGDTPRG